jgi:hypothetical protein
MLRSSMSHARDITDRTLTLYREVPWPTDGDPERRRTLNHLACLNDELGKRIAAVLDKSREVITLAMKTS